MNYIKMRILENRTRDVKSIRKIFQSRFSYSTSPPPSSSVSRQRSKFGGKASKQFTQHDGRPVLSEAQPDWLCGLGACGTCQSQVMIRHCGQNFVWYRCISFTMKREQYMSSISLQKNEGGNVSKLAVSPVVCALDSCPCASRCVIIHSSYCNLDVIHVPVSECHWWTHYRLHQTCLLVYSIVIIASYVFSPVSLFNLSRPSIPTSGNKF